MEDGRLRHTKYFAWQYAPQRELNHDATAAAELRH